MTRIESEIRWQDTLDYLARIRRRGSRPGLSRITELCARLGNPQVGMRFIHVAGTNGKGSVCAMLESVLGAAGYRTGMYVSPGLCEPGDGIRVSGCPIGRDALASLIGEIQWIAESMTDPPTEFELLTAVALCAFARAKCQMIIMEAGMGGRLDSTNVIDSPEVCVVTGVDYDHMAFLGKTLRAIAGEKAGILKPGAVAVLGDMPSEAEDVLNGRAAQLGLRVFHANQRGMAEFHCDGMGSDWDDPVYGPLHLPLVGYHQLKNASVALCVLDQLRENGMQISNEDLRQGLAAVRWPARFERLMEQPVCVIYDGAHNPQGIRACLDCCELAFHGKPVHVLTGVMADKDYGEMARMLKNVALDVVTVTPDNPRALNARQLAEVYRAAGIPADAEEYVTAGVQKAYRRALQDGIPLLGVGSLYLYHDFRRTLHSLRGRI